MILSIKHPKPYYYYHKHVPMFFIYISICLFSSTIMVTAQFENQNSFRHSSNPPGAGIALGIATGLVIVLIIFLKFFFNSNLRVSVDGPGQRATIGLDPSVLETFPVFKYSEVVAHRAGTGPLECSVCLSLFEVDDDEGEKLRLLPKCNHVFHVGCVDPWLKDHSTCPLCRTNLVPESDELTQPDLSQITGPRTGEEVEVNASNEGDIEKGQNGKYKRWKSTEHVAEVEPMEEDGWKRFTLKLSKEDINKLGNKNGKLERAKSS